MVLHSLPGSRRTLYGLTYVTLLMTYHVGRATLTSVAVRRACTTCRVCVCACVYARAGRVAGRPEARYFHSILLAPARSAVRSCSSSLALSMLLWASRLSSTVAQRTVVVVVVVVTTAWHSPQHSMVRRGVSPSFRFARARSNLNYHFTLPFERTAAAATAETRPADSPVYFSSAPFSHFVPFFSVSPPFLSVSFSFKFLHLRRMENARSRDR